MAKQNTLIHVNSNELNYTGDGAKNPQITDLNYGEIAINYKSGYETIFIKNDTDTIIPFNPVSLTEKDFWNQKDRIFNSDKSINVICSTNGVIIGDSTNIVIGTCSVAEGSGTTASGICSHAEGTGTIANGNHSHAEGDGTIASGNDSHAEGYVTIASGNHSHAEGNRTTASGTCSHAEGSGTTANGAASHTEGAFTIAYNTYEHAGGRYNSSTSGNSSSTGATIFSIGIGTSDSDRKNAIEVTQTGALIANTSWTTGSDRKLKDNITLLEDGVLDKVLKLKPSRFTLKADLEEEKRVQIGFIAQEIEEVFPEYVVIHTDNKGEETRYLDYEKICVVLTKALQEQQEIIDKQNERLSIIEQKLNIL